ncbi:MAG: translation initiation factor IF-2 [Gemmatimonadetes bacterium]|nr:translation initiation factor IF-2 [Gemmatimonadota bacterium]
MKVRDLAADLKVKPDILVRFLRKGGVRVGHPDAPIRDSDVARIRMRLERERRAGKGAPADVMRAELKGDKPVSRRRRVRRRRAPVAPAGDVDTPSDAGAEPTGLPIGEAAAPVAAEGVAATAAAVGDGPATAAGEAPGVAAADTATAPSADSGEPGSPVAEGAAAKADSAPPGPDGVAVEPTAGAPVSVEPSPGLEEPAGPAGAEEGAAADQPFTDPAMGIVPPAAAPPGERAPIPAGDAPPPSAPPTAARAGLPPPPSVRQGLGDPGAGVRSRPEPAASAGPGGKVRIQAEGYTSDGRRKRDRRKGRRRRGANRDLARENIQRVMAEIKSGGRKRRKGKATVAAAKEEKVAAKEEAARKVAAEARRVRVNEFLTVAELAELVDVSATEIIGTAFRDMGLPLTINQRLDFDQIELLLEGFGFTAVREADYLPAAEAVEEDDPKDLRPRPPVVTVMGHVDHGKTKLLDWIRNTNVVAGEAGGITQHIGAYHLELDDGRTLSFLDTPGHAAFTAMRARGADVTDLVILVVAADDAVMPQTVEAVSHARNAGVPMVVAINKIDLPTADPGKVKQDLLRHQVTVEDFGGDTLVAEVSAKTGQGMDDLLDKVLLQAELLELKSNPFRDATGAVVEAELDIGKGPVATILVQSGTLKVGDNYVVGLHSGRVRALLDERGQSVDEVGPGIPVQILGTAGVPQAGDVLQVMDADQAVSIAGNRQRLDREKQLRIKERGIKLGDFSQLLAAGEASSLRLVVKGDVDGSVQALCDAMEQLSTSEVQVEIIHRGVGAVNESDVMLALTAGAVVMGFRVRPDGGARQAASREGIEIQTYDIIYEAVDNVRAALEGLLAPERKERVVGAAEVRVVFKIRGVGTIAGSYVVDGSIRRGALARVIRDGVVVYDGEIGSLKRFKDDAREVKEGYECGIGIANFNDVKTDDIIETYDVEEVARTLAEAEAV